MSDFVTLISRVLMSSVFILYGYFKFLDPASVLASPATKRFMELAAGGAPAPSWLGYAIAAIELLGGLAILVGIKTRWVAWAFVLYVIIVTPLGHPFWLLEGAARAANQGNFYKNLAIIAAYMLLAISGPGRFSVDGSDRGA